MSKKEDLSYFKKMVVLMGYCFIFVVGVVVGGLGVASLTVDKLTGSAVEIVDSIEVGSVVVDVNETVFVREIVDELNRSGRLGDLYMTKRNSKGEVMILG